MINNIARPLARLTKKQRTQINKIRNERGDVTTDTTEIWRNLRDCREQLYTKKLDNLEKMDKFLETYNLSKWNQEFPGGPVVRTLHFQCHGLASIPSQGTKIPQAVAICVAKKKKRKKERKKN